MPHVHVELIVGAVKIDGDPTGVDLKEALTQYYMRQPPGLLEVHQCVDQAIERISTAAVRAVQGLQAPLEGAIPLIGLVAPVRA